MRRAITKLSAQSILEARPRYINIYIFKFVTLYTLQGWKYTLSDKHNPFTACKVIGECGLQCFNIENSAVLCIHTTAI